MRHLLVFLLQDQARLPLAALAALCLAGGLAVRLLLSVPPPPNRPRRICRIGAFAAVGAGFNWLVFLGGLGSGFPALRPHLPAAAILPGSAASLLCDAAAAGLLLRSSRRPVRTLLLAGTCLSCGLSVTVLFGMEVLVRPFQLDYDLGVVAASGLVASVLFAFALYEARGRRWLLPVTLFATAALAVALGSLGAILPFDRWVDAIGRTDDISAFPIATMLAISVASALAMTLSGSIIDSVLARQEQRQIARVRRLADSTFEGILIHRGGRILDANRTLLGMVGYGLQELKQLPAGFLLPMDAACSEPGTEDGDRGPCAADLLTRDGDRLPVEVLSRGIDYVGGPAQVTAVRDMRERREAERRIHHLANHDTLTDLPNRRQFEQGLEQALALAARSNSRVAVCCLDLDGFKAVNDRYGHAAGDLLLRQVADRLRTECRGGDLVARLGGDEFVLVLQPGARSEQAAAVAHSLVHLLGVPFSLDGIVAHIGVSVGIASFPDDGATIESLFGNADLALYRAKERGRGQFCLFEAGMDQTLIEERALEQDLRDAIATGGLSLHYQPLFDGRGRVIAFEALARWQHPVHGAIPPCRFIPLAERSGLIVKLGAHVLRSACREAAGWAHGCRVAVNLSPAQFKHGRLLQVIEQALEQSGLPPERLEIEVTEGLLIDDAEQALPVLVALRERRVRVVLDDFGTGYSSLGYLHNFPFDKVKIDRSFIERIENDRRAMTIVDAIIAMSHKLDLEVTAEGIETDAQLAMLTRHGCDELQGFLLGRPMQAALVPGFLLRHGAAASFPAGTPSGCREAQPAMVAAAPRSTDSTRLTPRSCMVTP